MATVLKFYNRFRFWLSACGSASTYKFLSELDDSLRSCDVILIFQDGRQSRTSTFGFSIWSWLTLQKIKKLCARQTSIRYSNPRPRYYYFRLLEINRRHIEIPLPDFTLTISSSSVCDFVSPPVKCYSNLMIGDRIMTSYRSSKMAATAPKI